jgi:hypothetical protein
MTRRLRKEEGDLQAVIQNLRRNRSITDHGRREQTRIPDQVAQLSASKFTRLKSDHTIQKNSEQRSSCHLKIYLFES